MIYSKNILVWNQMRFSFENSIQIDLLVYFRWLYDSLVTLHIAHVRLQDVC